MAAGRGAEPRSRRSRSKGRTAEQQFATARRRIQTVKETGATELDLSGLRKLAVLPPEIAQLSTLQSLNLTRTRVGDLTSLVSLTNLRYLDIDGTNVTDLTPLASLTGLQILDLSRTGVSDLTPLAGLTALEVLHLGRTQVIELAPLAKLTGLQRLTLPSTQVSDLTPLVGLTTIEVLNLANTQVSDLAPLAGLSTLQVLYLTNTTVSDLTPLAELTTLRHLALGGTQVRDLTAIAYLTGLANAAVTGDALFATGGLIYTETPSTRTLPFNRLHRLDQPARTVETLNQVRRQQGLAAHFPEDYEPPIEIPLDDLPDAEETDEHADGEVLVQKPASEPPRVCRRLQILRDWSYGESQDVPEVLRRGARARGADGD